MLKHYTVIFFSCVATLCLSAMLTGCSSPEPKVVCTDSIGCVTIPPDAPLKIGVLQALSGDVAPLGVAQIRGLELALEQREGLLLGHPVALQVVDTGCTAEGGANAALKVIADPDTVAIFGTTCSGAAATASKAMSDAGLSMISGNNSAPFLTAIAGKAAPSWQKGYFRTAPNEENAGRIAAEYAYSQLGLRRAATINDNDIYTRGLTEGFKKAFLEFGGEVVLATSINKGDTQMVPVLTAVAHARADLLFFPLFQPEGNHILQQARSIPELAETVLISGGALIEQTFIDAVGKDADGMYFVGPASPSGQAVDKLAGLYEGKYNEKPTVSYYLSAYDAANLLFSAIEQAQATQKDGTLLIGRQKLRDVLYSGKPVKGVTGTLSCDEFGDCAQPSFRVLRLDDPALGVQGLEENAVFTGTSK